jgi:ATP-dependent DNA helicase RecQ
LFNEALQALQKYYGYKEFRASQKDVIQSILNKKDTLAIMPTGGGKSICYQIPAMLFEGLTIVISPLISLMKDQVDNIVDLGINAAYINSSLSYKSIINIIEQLKAGDIKLLYLAPERLEAEEFCELLKSLDIAQVAIDEAHCVSQWGHDFRTSYRYISKFIKMLPERPLVTAFTATATEEVREDIIRLLDLKNPQVFISGFDRENLKINVLKLGDRLSYLINYITYY